MSLKKDFLYILDDNLFRTIPEQLIRRHKLFPLKRERNRIYIAMSDPQDIIAMDDLRLITGCDIEPVSASEKDVNGLIEKYFGIPEVEKALRELGIHFGQDEEIEQGEPLKDEAPVIRLVNVLIKKGFDEDASDIHIEPFKEGIRVRYRVDGMLREVMRLPRKMLQPLVTRVKVMACMDIAERRLPQDGRFPLKMEGRDIDLRISTMPTVFGEKVVIRILYKDNIENYNLKKLGLSLNNARRFESLIKNSCGMVLVTGPTGSGKTTTLYTVLSMLNTPEKCLYTVEDPVEYILEGVSQAQVNVKAGITFSNCLRSILRQDPDIIMIGEIRDYHTAESAVQAATTGHLVLSTLHTNDAPGALNRLIDMGIEPFMVASSVVGVVSQRLVRRICEQCRQVCSPDEFEQTYAGLQQDQRVYKGQGCDHCNFTGYRGRIAIYEVLPVTTALQTLIMGRVSSENLRRAAIIEGMVTLREDGIQKALDGQTTIREVARAAYKEVLC